MPSSPYSRACGVPGCGAPIHYRGHCRRHAAVTDQVRGLHADRRHLPLYQSAEWRRLRRQVLIASPTCQCDDCRRLGLVRAATVVDHRQPHRGDPARFFDRDNLQAMAKRCHDRKTWRDHRAPPLWGSKVYKSVTPRTAPAVSSACGQVSNAGGVS